MQSLKEMKQTDDEIAMICIILILVEHFLCCCIRFYYRYTNINTKKNKLLQELIPSINKLQHKKTRHKQNNLKQEIRSLTSTKPIDTDYKNNFDNITNHINIKQNIYKRKYLNLIIILNNNDTMNNCLSDKQLNDDDDIDNFNTKLEITKKYIIHLLKHLTSNDRFALITAQFKIGINDINIVQN